MSLKSNNSTALEHLTHSFMHRIVHHHVSQRHTISWTSRNTIGSRGQNERKKTNGGFRSKDLREVCRVILLRSGFVSILRQPDSGVREERKRRT
jgi:hypothetical protein